MTTGGSVISRDSKLAKIVKDLTGAGKLPEASSIEDPEVQSLISPKQKEVLVLCFDAVEEFLKVDEAKERSGSGPRRDAKWAELWLKARAALEEAVTSGLLHLEWVQERAVFFGAIPHPTDSFKYYGDPSGTYHCWRCGGEVKVVQQSCSLWERPLVGYGEVRVIPRPYCPQCEEKPSSTGVIYYKDLPLFDR